MFVFIVLVKIVRVDLNFARCVVMMRLWWLSVEKALVPALWSRKQNSNGPTGPSEIMRKAQKRYEHRPGSDEC